MRIFFKKFLSIKGDSTQQVVDLLLFFGYFIICFYAGGIAYERSYNNIFHIQSHTNPNDIGLAVHFVINVLGRGWNIFPSSIFIILFIALFYSCRYVWRPWFGYFLLSFLLYFTFLTCGLLGESTGSFDAKQDRFKETKIKSIIKIFGHSLNGTDYFNANYYLLWEDKNNFHIFEPQSVEGSVLVIHTVSKKKVDHYEIFIK